jgi:ABC-type multidrug transport system fused ATPase/permease subunit
MLQELPRASRPLTGALAVVVLAAGLTPAGLVLAVGSLADAILDPTRDVTALAVVVGLFFITQQVLGPAATQLADALGRRLNRRLRDRVMAACLVPDGIGHLEAPDTLALVSGASEVGTTKVTAREAVVSGVAVTTLRLQGVCCAAVLAGFHWWLALLMLVVFGMLTMGAVADFRAGAPALGEAPALLRRPSYLRGLAVDLGAAKDLRLFGLRCWIDQRFHQEWMGAVGQLRGKGQRHWWMAPALGIGTLASQLAVYVWLAVSVADGTIGVGNFVAYAGAVLGVVGILAVSPDNLNLAYGTAAIPQVARLEAAVPPARDRPSGPVTLTEGVRFQDVSFTYPGRDRPVFERLNLDIPAGRSLAIVGLNGAGKSTLVKLLCGLYEPDGGRILVDGVPLSSLDPREWRHRVAAVFQDFVRYQLAAEDNVAFGAWEHVDDREGVAASARQAGAEQIVERHGCWDRDLADGEGLSGGQWQRIALARAFFAVRHGAQLLVMDEPTAALDARAEAEFNAGLLAGLAGVTPIVISHRFATVRPADRIVVLRDGRITEDGDHDALVRADGEYARLFRLQAESFLEDDEGVTGHAD